METTILLKLGGWVASTAVGFIADQVQHYINDHFQFQRAVKDKLKCLEEDLQTIQAVLCEADRRRIENKPLGDWLQAIKDATYDAEDVLDMFEYKIIQEKEEGTASTVKKCIVSGDVVKKLNEVVDKFKRIAARRSDMFQLINSQPAVSQWVSEIMQLRESTSMPIKSVGRDKERAQLMQLLNQFSGDDGGSSSCRNYSRATGGVGKTTLVQDVLPVVGTSSVHVLPVVGIGGVGKTTLVQDVLPVVGTSSVHVLPVVGIGGVGKTTLVQDVYNNQDVKHLFDLKAWVCVSDNFDVKRLTKEIIESASISKPDDFNSLQNLDRIQQILQNGLKDKRFLIVLDDIWNENNRKWEQLQRVLNCGKDGSRVIVTTRNGKIAKMMGTKEAIHLEGLVEEEFWRFFRHCAFGDENPANYPGLEFVGKQIAEKLKGNPLAAKTVGALLEQELTVHHWRGVLESELWKRNEEENGIMEILKLSYEYLPSKLKQCFVYCSLFPKDYRYEKTKLVQMWIAHGFIKEKLPSGQLLEKIGEDYFNELLRRSFIHDQGYDGYVIHDLLHDLAQSLSDGEIYIAENDEAHISSPKKKVRHISICANNLSLLRNDKLGNYENVRSLVVFDCSVEKILDVLSELKGLRVLVLRKFPVALSLKFIQKMLHLRYLEISSRYDPLDGSFNMPELVCKLYHLQVLRIPLRYERCVLPNEINRLIKLRHLEAGKPKGIGKLTLLQELKFKVNQGEKGLDIGQIRDMSELTTLCLEGLETVKTKEQASQAMLNNKKHLKDLKLEWKLEEEEEVLEGSQPQQNQNRLSNRRGSWLCRKGKEDNHINLLHNEEDVLEGLQPHTNLEQLVIKGYGGGGTPSWWNANWASNLITLKLWDCSKWEFLPPLGHLPFLKILIIVRMNAVRSIERMNAVRSIGSEFYASNNSVGLSSKTIFPSLEEFRISEMPELKDWSKIEEGGGGGGRFELFPRLKDFRIAECPKLRGSIFQFPPSNFNHIHVDISNSAFFDHKTEGLYINCDSAYRVTKWLPYPNLLTSIEHLTIGHEMGSCFPTKLVEWIQHLTSLHSLCFSYCIELESLPSNLINSLSTLRILKIVNCPKIKSLPEGGLPASLQELLLEDCCRELESLPSNLSSLSTLRILKIVNCPKIKSLPEEGLPASIQELHVSRCYDLAKRCMNEYWQKMIAHIPTFTVNYEVVTEENRKSLAAIEEDEEEE